MPPPLLTADAPVLEVAHPSKIGVFVLLGYKLNVAVFDCRDGGFGQRPNFDKPLVG